MNWDSARKWFKRSGSRVKSSNKNLTQWRSSMSSISRGLKSSLKRMHLKRETSVLSCCPYLMKNIGLNSQSCLKIWLHKVQAFRNRRRMAQDSVLAMAARSTGLQNPSKNSISSKSKTSFNKCAHLAYLTKCSQSKSITTSALTKCHAASNK